MTSKNNDLNGQGFAHPKNSQSDISRAGEQDISVINFEGMKVRFVNIHNELWFIAKDVCNALEAINSRDALTALDPDEKNTVALTCGICGNLLCYWREVAIMINRQYLIGTARTARKMRPQHLANAIVRSRAGYSFDFLRSSALSLRPQASSTQAEKLDEGLSSFSLSTLASISSIKSCGKRIPLYSDLLFLWPVAMLLTCEKCFNTKNHTARSKNNKVFKQNSIDVFKHFALWYLNTLSTGDTQITKPSSALTLTGLLTTPLLGVTLWLIHSLPKLTPNLYGTFWYWEYRLIGLFRLFVLLPPPGTKYGRNPPLAVSWFSLVACPFRRCVMFDNTPLEQEEVIDQCRALAYAAVNTDERKVREILLFILQERIDHLYHASQAEPEQAEVSHA